MKTHIETHFFDYIINKPLQQWKNFQERLGLSWQSFRSFFLSVAASFGLVNLTKKLNLKGAPVHKAHVSHVLQALALSVTTNIRTYVGWFLVGVSPLAACIYLLFDRSVKIEGWYHENYFYMFMLLGPYLFFFVALTGIYMMIPVKLKTIKVYKWSILIQMTRVMSYPIGFCITKILWFIQTESNAEYWEFPTWHYCLVGLVFAYLTTFVIDYCTWRKFHALDGLIATANGLDKKEIPSEIRREHLPQYIKELVEFDSKY